MSRCARSSRPVSAVTAVTRIALVAVALLVVVLPGADAPAEPMAVERAGASTSPAAPTFSVPSAALSLIRLSAEFDDGTRALGTGIVLTPTGEVLTCDHVVDQARTVTATSVSTGRTYPATLLNIDRGADTAVIQLHDAPDLPSASGLTAARRGDPSRVAVGEAVTAVGSRDGAPSDTPGTVTALDQSITVTDSAGGRHPLDGLIEFRAALHPGDSGSALVDDRGEVIAMIAAASHDPAEALGAAVPIDRAVAAAGS